MTDLENLTINSISYEWLEKTNDPKLLKKAIRLLKEDGGYFPDLEAAIDKKLQTLDLKYKKYKETENITLEDINKAKEEMLKFEEEFNKKDKILSENKDEKNRKSQPAKNISLHTLPKQPEKSFCRKDNTCIHNSLSVCQS